MADPQNSKKATPEQRRMLLQIGRSIYGEEFVKNLEIRFAAEDEEVADELGPRMACFADSVELTVLGKDAPCIDRLPPHLLPPHLRKKYG